MKISAGKFSVEVRQVPQKGTPWEVSVNKTIIGFKKRITSDWFLDGEQAKRFASQLAADLQSGDSLENVLHRSAGWTLHKPVH